jgi:hypothetical protein
MLELVRPNSALAHDRARAIELAQVANDRHGSSWQTRCVAADLLGVELRRIAPDDEAEFRWWFAALGLCSSPDAELLDTDVLRQGYSTSELAPFVREFRLRLAWGAPNLLTNDDDDDDETTWLERAEQPCRIPLARYLISAEDVVAQILAQLLTSEGIEEAGVGGRAVEATLPHHEAAIISGLRLPGRVFWLAPNTPRRINGLVEHPHGTAAVVIKPPGSTLELEIKRVGLGAARPLDVILRRDAKDVPGPHRFQGVCLGRLLNFEVYASARLQRVREAVWGDRASPRFLVVNRIVRVARAGGTASLVDHLTDPQVWPPAALERLTTDVRAATDAFLSEHGQGGIAFAAGPGRAIQRLPGMLGAAAELVALTRPSQGVLVGTCAHRLDQLARLLAVDGLEPALALELGLDTPDAVRCMNDTLLRETIADYEPPPGELSDASPIAFLAAARAHNRVRIERVFLQLVAELGRMFACLVALRGYSKGESFVARNVGLRAVWEAGEARVRMIFMDHDDLHLPSPRHRFDILDVLGGLRLDHMFAFGAPDATTSFAKLCEIYGCDAQLRLRGLEHLHGSARQAYAHTRACLRSDALLAHEFQSPRDEDLDTWLAAYRSHRQGPRGWVARVVVELERSGCAHETANRLGLFAREADEFVGALARLTETEVPSAPSEESSSPG